MNMGSVTRDKLIVKVQIEWHCRSWFAMSIMLLVGVSWIFIFYYHTSSKELIDAVMEHRNKIVRPIKYQLKRMLRL